MGKFSKVWLPLAIIMLIVSACSGNSGNKAGSESSNAVSAEADAVFAAGKYDPPIEISTVIMPKEYTQGDTKDNNVHDRWMLETLGIKHKDTWYPAGADQYKQQLQLALTSGEKLPDFVYVPTDAVLTNQLIDSGQFIAIDELFEKYASPIWKEHVEQNPEVWYPFTRDGKKWNSSDHGVYRQ